MFYDKVSAGYILRIRVTPNASKCSTGDIFTDSNNQDFLKINLTAVPEKGKANQELIKFLSKLLHISKSNFTLISGETDRYKKIALNIPPSAENDNLLETLEHPK
ncbi:MAG: DUF167 domain-containing protein [Alphaproteobacteria bacterium]|nr:DUF167 domain-containing protein [Alphaproteobacteria bacterium]